VSETSQQGLGPKRGLLIAFLAGAGIMLLELVAPRVVQPWFGASSFVWTNVIGVILVALALGYQCGGMMAARAGRQRRIGLGLIIAGVLAALVPWLAGPLAEWVSPTPTQLAELPSSNRILELGSLLVSVLLFAPPVLLIATVTPQLVAELETAGKDAGRAAGQLFALGTLGSLVGTFLPTYVLVPMIGSRATVMVAATLLLGSGVIALVGIRTRTTLVASSLIALTGVGQLGLTWVPMRAQQEFEHSLVERETAYQYLRIAEETAREDGSTRERVLKIDEGLRDFHSVALDARPTTGGKYYDTIAALGAALPAEGEPWRVAILGSGAGTTAALLRRHWGDRVGKIVNVDIDPEVLALESAFGFERAAGDLSLALDGRAFLRLALDEFDLIVVDAYARQIDIPAHMASVEFFETLRERLSARGIVALNASSRDLESPLLQGLARSMMDAGLPAPWASPVQYWGNVILWTARNEAPDLSLVGSTPEALLDAREYIGRWSSRLSPGEDAPRLEDGHAPTEWLGLQERLGSS
jgi:spermidine synthase